MAKWILIMVIMIANLTSEKRDREQKTTMGEKDTLIIGTWNKGGKWNSKLNSKLPEIENILKTQKIDILAIQEANWTSTTDEQTVHIKGYEIIADKGRNNKKRRNSRTIIYIKDNLHYEILHNKMRENTPEIWIRISEPGKRKTDLITFYREYKQWNGIQETKKDQEERFKKWCNDTSDKMLRRGDTILIGDMNADWYRKNDTKYQNKKIIDIAETTLGNMGMRQMVREYTRIPINNDKPSMIDWILTNAEQKVKKVSTTYTSSDHKLIRMEWKVKLEIEPEYGESRNWKNVDMQKVRDHAKKEKWENEWDEETIRITNEIIQRTEQQEREKMSADTIIINENQDKKISKQLDSNIRAMINRMSKILDKCGAKIETKEKVTVRPKFITKDIKEDIKRDEELRDNLKDKGEKATKEDIEQVRNHHRRTNRKLKKAKINATKNTIAKKMDDARNLFEGIKNYNNEGGDGAPKQFKINNKLIKSKKEMSEAQHDYYDNKLKTVEKKVGKPTGNYMRILENRTKDRESIMRVRKITPEEIRKEIARVKDKPSYGTDKISYTVLKTFVNEIKKPLAEIGTVSFINGIYPEKWKKSIVKPLYKGGQKIKTDPASYRPVSLLDAAGRIIEGIMAERMSQFAENRKILPAQMHGYRPGLGSTSALIELQGDLLRKNAEGKITGMSLLDVSAGFDTVPHAYLLRKLEAIGYSQRTLKWFSSYLDNRWASVQIGGERSKKRKIKKGIPQGGPMSPALWREYTIDLTGSLTPETTQWRRELWRERQDYKESTWKEVDKRNSIVTRRGMKQWQNNELDEEGRHDLLKHAGRKIKIRTGEDDEKPIMGKLELEKGYTLYVDDCSTRASGKTIAEVKQRQKNATLAIFQTMRESRLCINADKTQIMVVMSKQRRQGLIPRLEEGTYSLELETHVQKEIEHGEILGVTISNDLTWTENWRKTKQKISRKLSKLIPMQKILGKKNRKKVIESSCVSLLQYCIEVTSGGGKKLIKDMNNTLSKLARYVMNKKHRDYSKTGAFKDLNWLSVPQMIYWQSMKTLLKYKRENKPTNVIERIIDNAGEVREITKQQLENMPKTSRQGWEIRVRRWWKDLDPEFKTNNVNMREEKWSKKLKKLAKEKYPVDGEKILYGDV